MEQPDTTPHRIHIQNTTLHALFLGTNDMTMARDHEAIHNEKTRRFLTWPVARLLQIVYNDTTDYVERCVYLMHICDKRIEPVMPGLTPITPNARRHDLIDLLRFKEWYAKTGLTPITPNARQDLIDLLQFKEWYASDDVPKIEPIGAILKRYPIQALRDTIDTLPARYQRHLTTYGPYAF